MRHDGYDTEVEAPVSLGPGNVNPVPVVSAGIGASIFTALQEQLGLRLEARKGLVDMMGIGDVEKIPTGN
jgi:uncharacterized protein (TIGR03435 family)